LLSISGEVQIPEHDRLVNGSSKLKLDTNAFRVVEKICVVMNRCLNYLLTAVGDILGEESLPLVGWLSVHEFNTLSSGV
jgi:hypothetical protein